MKAQESIPDVSIIITNYNYGRFLDRCIRSCLNQKEVSHEVIVVDDCSTDNSIDIVSPFLDSIKFIKTKENSGVSFSSNLGIQNAKGRFFFRVDADDYISEYTSLFLSKYLQTNKKAFCVSCDYFLVDNYENKIERKFSKFDNISCGVMYRKDLFLEAGGYNEKMRHCEEEELRKRIGKKYEIHHLDIPFYRYRMHDSNKTKSKEYKSIIKEFKK